MPYGTAVIPPDVWRTIIADGRLTVSYELGADAESLARDDDYIQVEMSWWEAPLQYSGSGGNGNDELWSGGGDDTVVGGTGHDQLYGGDGADALRGEAGLDNLWGGRNDDLLWAAPTGTG